MTTIITRLYADDATAQSVVAALVAKGIDEDSIQVIGSADIAAIKAANVDATSAAAYSAAMTGGQKLVVVEVGFNPQGAARKAIKTVSRTPSINVGLSSEDNYIEESLDPAFANSVMDGSPLLLTNSFVRLPHGHIFGSNPVIHSRPRSSAIRGGAYMVPMTRISTPKTKSSAIRGGKLISSLFGLGTLYHR
jgi:hypothetical protein